jgi:hypothetical protein
MVETILLAFLVAKLRKYRLTPLFKEWTIYPVFAFALIYVYLDYTIFKGDYSLVRYSTLFRILYYGMFSILILKHKQYRAGFIAFVLIMSGGILNNIVMKANGGKMPVFPSLSYITGYIKPDSFDNMAKHDSIHMLGSSSTRLAFLSDKIDLGYTIMSAGDVLMHLMAFVIIFGVIKHLNISDTAVIHEIAQM